METNNVVSIEEFKERKNIKEAMARAAYWAVIIEDTYRALEYAERQREDAMRDAGMLSEEKGLKG